MIGKKEIKNKNGKERAKLHGFWEPKTIEKKY